MSLLTILDSVLLVSFLSLVFFSNEEKNEINTEIETDTTDYDGGGNYGRIPDKKPKNRAI